MSHQTSIIIPDDIWVDMQIRLNGKKHGMAKLLFAAYRAHYPAQEKPPEPKAFESVLE